MPGFELIGSEELREITDVFAHDAYLRMYVKVSAQSAAYLPCPP